MANFLFLHCQSEWTYWSFDAGFANSPIATSAAIAPFIAKLKPQNVCIPNLFQICLQTAPTNSFYCFSFLAPMNGFHFSNVDNHALAQGIEYALYRRECLFLSYYWHRIQIKGRTRLNLLVIQNPIMDEIFGSIGDFFPTTQAYSIGYDSVTNYIYSAHRTTNAVCLLGIHIHILTHSYG